MAGRWRTGKLVPVAIGLSLLISVPETAARLRCRRLLAQHGNGNNGAQKRKCRQRTRDVFMFHFIFPIFVWLLPKQTVTR